MLTNPEEFQHLPTVDDDDHMAEDGAPLERHGALHPEVIDSPEAQEQIPEVQPVPPSPQVVPSDEPPHEVQVHAKESVDVPGHEIIPEDTPATPAPVAEAMEPQTPEAKTPPKERIKLAKAPVIAAEPASDAPSDSKDKTGAPKSPPPLKDEKKKDKATKRIPAAEKEGKEAQGQPAEEHAAHLEALKAAAKSQAEAAEAAAPPKEPWRERWEKWGGRSLAVSVGAHLLLLITAAVTVFHHVIDKQIDFLPGGSSVQGQQAQQALQHKIQQKKNPWLKQSMPSRKIAVASSMNNLVLPKTEMPDVLDLPQTSKPLGGGAMSGGFGLAGTGGGFGNGVGLGAKNGIVFGSLFGMNIKARKLAVVLDVSYSMTPHLERVVKEVDKVAKGSVVMLYFGCGLAPPPKALAGTKVFKTSTTEFEKFWRLGGATYMDTAKFKIDKKDPIPNQQLFLQLSRRPQTYFIHSVGVEYAWLALLSDEVRNADGLYWFCDFQDTVDFKQLGVVLENLQRRKQRLYIHSYGKGQYFDLIKNQLVEPTKGDSFVEE